MTQQHPSGPPVTSATLPRDFSLNRPPASTSPSTSTLPRVRSSGQSSVDNRGRALTRNLFINPNAPPLTDEERAQLEEGTEQTTFVDSPTTWKQRSKSRRNSQASRRGASIVFLGVWALFGFGHLAGRGILNTPSPSVATGKVLASPTPDPLPSNPWPSSLSHPNLYVTELVYASQNQTDPPHHPPKREPLSRSYIIGRISAWTCATLYLTSRLPQIWKIVSQPVIYSPHLIYAFFPLVYSKIRRRLIYDSFCVCISCKRSLCQFTPHQSYSQCVARRPKCLYPEHHSVRHFVCLETMSTC